MPEVFQIHCAFCGAEASEGENMHHAETLAKAEGFINKPGRWVCSDCGTVKKMVTNDTKSYEDQGVKKV